MPPRQFQHGLERREACVTYTVLSIPLIPPGIEQPPQRAERPDVCTRNLHHVATSRAGAKHHSEQLSIRQRSRPLSQELLTRPIALRPGADLHRSYNNSLNDSL